MRFSLRKLIRNLILISIPLILVSLFAAIFPMRYMAVEYTMWQEEKDYVKNGDNATTLVLGDSRAKSGIIPENLSKGVYNAAIGGATAIEMYYACRNYLNNHPSPERAIVIFAPYHFCEIDNWQQTLYYNYLTVPELAEVETGAFKTGEAAVGYSGWITDIISFKLRLPNKYLDAIYQAKFTGNFEANKSKYDSVMADCGYTEFGTDNGNDGLNYETHHETFDYSELVLDYYDRLMNLLEENGVETYIIQSPINEASGKVISSEFWTGYDKFLTAVENEYPEFTVEHEVPVYDNIYFGDNNHMNRKGAEKFTAVVKEKYNF